MVDTSPDWRAPMASYLDDHLAYLCKDLVAELALRCKPESQCK
jgi:hypothetical protein